MFLAVGHRLQPVIDLQNYFTLETLEAGASAVISNFAGE
jgi:hypothetical protein